MTTQKTLKVGVVGTGNISSIYLRNGAWLAPIDVLAVADMRHEAAVAQAAAFDIDLVYTPAELLADPAIDIVLNLTTPEAHGTVGLSALEAGKSVYNEKPLTLTRAEAQEMLQLAQEKGLRVGCAPDTFLGAGIQTCRQLIDDGVIGRPVAATAFMMCPGHESWHPNPDFYYQPGGGPMFDMGPYYLTALVNLLGPVTAVSGMVSKGQSQRTISSQPLAGQVIDVNVATHVAGLMTFANGAVATIVTSFDVQGHEHPHIEIYGTKATLSVPDPNTFGGTVRIKRAGQDWEDVALTHSYAANSRGLGLADMAEGIVNGRAHRANGELAYHVLDLMWALHDSAAAQQHIRIKSSCDLPEAMPPEFVYGKESIR
jgi:predicted dehydrogenase